MSDRVAIASVRRLESGQPRNDQDLVAVEAPLAIELGRANSDVSHRFGVLMRTPGQDDDLILGLLYSEGIIRALSDVERIDVHAGGTGDGMPDTATIHVAPHVNYEEHAIGRALAGTSACGLCGRLEMLAVDRGRGSAIDGNRLSTDVIASIPGRLREGQTVFAETGGLHAAGLFDLNGTCRVIAEDVGRHNAVDKVFGWALRHDCLPAPHGVLGVSGRVAFEIVQKAAAAGVMAIVAVGAPSNLAVDAARAARLTLVGFVRGEKFNVYTIPERVDWS